jgi:tetratricopeptide (TPR) repeat protein
VNTGEVIVGTHERLATGDAVNVAARLQNAADPGEILTGEATHELVRIAVESEPVAPLELKGKAEAVPAYRLVSVLEAPERGHGSRFVGREREVELIREAWRRVQVEQTCELVTIVGDPGVGKSRLVAEALAVVDTPVLRGRCLPYGEGITYWPVVEVVKQLDALPADPDAEAAIRSLLGETDRGVSPEEIAWAFRKLVEEQAPLIVVFDDIQWGEATFLDLVEGVALLSSGRQILLLCIARSELTEIRAAWPVTVRLEPLREEAVAELLPERLSVDLRERITRAAGGNPLFLEEMLVVAIDADGDVVVPPTLQALLAARLDQLDPAERGVLERAAIEGEIFHRGAVQALAPTETQITPLLASLVRRQLIRPDRPHIAGEDGFRFRHLLIRDAAYEALPKSVRADLHQRFGSWLEQRGSGLVERDELVGYHLEQAYKYRLELGMPRDDDLAETARRRLMESGRRAARRQDFVAAASLFERAVALLPSSEIDLALEIELGDALFWTGGNEDALRRAEAFAERAVAVGDRVAELSGRIRAGTIRLTLESEGTQEALALLVDQALPAFELANDDLALYVAHAALGELAATRGRIDTTLEAYERAFVHAARAGYEPSFMVGMLAWCRFAGSTPVAELVAWLDETGPDAARNQFVRAYRAWSLAKLGRFDEARTVIAEARADQLERGGGALLANLIAFESVWIELLAGDAAAAAEYGAEGCRLHDELGEQRFLAGAAASLAQALYALARIDEAEAWADRAAVLAMSDEVSQQSLWRQTKAKVLALRGDRTEAERLAYEAVEIIDDSDMLDAQAGAYADLGEVLLLTGRPDQAADALERALDRYARKGNLAMVAQVRPRLDAVRAVSDA